MTSCMQLVWMDISLPANFDQTSDFKHLKGNAFGVLTKF